MTTTLTNVLPEQAVLGCILQGDIDSAKALLSRLRAEDFSEPRHRAVLEAARAAVSVGEPPDPVTVLGRMRDQGDHVLSDTSAAGPYMVELMRAAPSLGSATYYAGAVLRDAYRRRVQKAGQRLTQAAESDSLDSVSALVDQEWAAVATAHVRIAGGFA